MGPAIRLDKPQGAVGFFINSILGDKPIEVWGDGSVERDFIFIDDAVEAISKAVLSEERSLLLNVGSGVSTSINELINTIGSETGKTPIIRSMPARPFDVHKSVLDIAAAKTSLGWTPKTDLRTGIRMTLKCMTR